MAVLAVTASDIVPDKLTAPPDPLVAFRRWLVERRYSTPTIRCYTSYVVRATRFMAPVALRDASLEQLGEFWMTVPDTAASRNQCRKALVLFFKTAGRKRGEPADEIPASPVPQGLPRPLGADGHAAFVEMATRLGGFHEAAGLLMAFTGCRISEARTARWDAFDLAGTPPTWRISGKGSGMRGAKLRLMPLHEQLVAALHRRAANCDYAVQPVVDPLYALEASIGQLAALQHSQPDQAEILQPAIDQLVLRRAEVRAPLTRGEFLFPGFSGTGTIGDTNFRNIIEVIASEAGLGKITPHQLRHTFATLILDRTDNLRLAQELLGHSSPTTTALYTQVLPGRLADAVGLL